MLHSRSPVTLLWGPEFVLVYNEAYVPLDAGLTERTEALRDRQQLTAEELRDHLLARFGADTEDDIVLTVIRADPH